MLLSSWCQFEISLKKDSAKVWFVGRVQVAILMNDGWFDLHILEGTPCSVLRLEGI